MILTVGAWAVQRQGLAENPTEMCVPCAAVQLISEKKIQAQELAQMYIDMDASEKVGTYGQPTFHPLV